MLQVKVREWWNLELRYLIHLLEEPHDLSPLSSTHKTTLQVCLFSSVKKHILMKQTAVAGAPDMDYDAVNGEIVQFAMGDTFQTHTIIINDDDLCEHEFFFALVVGVQPILVVQPQATVTIDDAAESECRK